MEDMEVVLEQCNTDYAIEIDNATLAWEKPVTQREKSEKPPSELQSTFCCS